MRKIYNLGLVWLLLSSSLFGQNVVINEFLASNETVISDPDFGRYSDWIEIYNAGSQTIRLDGYFISDDLTDQKWQFPANTLVQAYGFLVVWADGLDTTLSALHTNFKLSAGGEQLGLFAPDGSLLDSLSFPAQTADISYGRFPDGGTNWVFFNDPTPGASNSGSASQKAGPPLFSLAPGFYSQQQELRLSSTHPHSVIRYTLDCSDPDENSPVYDAPLVIKSRAGEPNFFSEILTTLDPEEWLPEWVAPAGEVFKATVVRARAWAPGIEPSDIVTATYFVDPNIHTRYPDIAVISLVSDYRNLFDDETGIYVPGNTHINGKTRSGNYFQDWEKPAHIEFFENSTGEAGFSQDVGIKIQGGTSQVSPQKGLHVFARDEYGDNRIDYPLFANTRYKAAELKEFKRFMIRSWGSTIGAALFNDAYAQTLVADMGMDINAYRPAVVFINGEYWGLHEIREANKNSWYYQFHYGIDRDDPGVDILEHVKRNDKPYAAADEGDANHWNAMVDFIKTHDMSLDENYNYIQSQMEVDNFITYIGHGIYLAKWDWPNNNEASWRPRTADGRWRWIVYDMETSFGVAEAINPLFRFIGAPFDMIQNVVYGRPIPGFGTYGPHSILPELLKNESFRGQFVQWFYDRMENEFAPERMIALLDEMAAEIEPYMAEYRQRWPFQMDMNNDWNYHLELIRRFARERPAYMKQHLQNEFGAETVVSQSTANSIPITLELYQNYPNPFNNSTVFSYAIPKSGRVVMKVFDVSGRFVASLVDGEKSVGNYRVEWSAKNLPSGIYYLVLSHGFERAVRKVVLVR